jgi:hypothetical protein
MRDPTAPAEWHSRSDAADDGTSTVWREDRGELLSSRPGPGGSLLVSGYAAREGILTYRNADGTTTREFVSREVLIESAKTLARAPLTLGHPRSDVTPENVGRLGVGDVGERITVHDDGFVQVSLSVRRKDAIDAINSGVHELSPGYLCQIDNIPGENQYGKFDRSQISRKTNHLALVQAARGGAEVRIRADAMDSAVATTVIHSDAGSRAGNPTPGVRMDPLLVSLLHEMGVSGRYDSATGAYEAALDFVRTQKRNRSDADQQRADALTAAQADLTTARTAEREAKAERDREKARADAAASELATLKAAEAERADAAERIRIAPLVTKHRIDAAKHATVADLKRAIASAVQGTAFRADASDDYVAATVDLALVSTPKPGERTSAKAWEQAGAGARADADTKPAPRRSRWDSAFEEARK